MPTLAELAGDRRRGALAIAVDAAELLTRLHPGDWPGAIATLVAAHPAMAPLRNLAVAADPAGFAEEMRTHLEEAAQAAAALVRGLRVLTVSASGLVEETLRRGSPREVHCLRSDPGGEGADLAGRIGGRLWEDADLARAAAHADLALTGADAVGPDAFVNKVGTRRMCEAVPTWLVDIPEKRLGAAGFTLCSAGTGALFEVVSLSLVRRP